MDTLDKVLGVAKKKRGTRFPFCAGIDGKNMVIGCSIQEGKSPKSLKNEFPADSYIAWGHVVWQENGDVQFDCEKLTPKFKAKEVKGLSSLLKKQPFVTQGGAVGAGEDDFKDADDDGREAPQRPDGAAPSPLSDAEGPGLAFDEKPTVVWEKALRPVLETENVDQVFLTKTKGLMAPYKVSFPAFMLQTLEDAGKQAFLQQVIDNLNARLKDDAVKIRKILEADLPDAKKVAAFDKIKAALDTHISTIVDKSWERFVSSFDVPGKWKQRMQKSVAVGIPAVGFAAGMAGVATAPVGLTAVVIVPSAIAALRSAAAGAEACKVYLGSVKMASDSLAKSAETLQGTLGVVRDEITTSEGAKAGAKAIANALAGAGVQSTIKTVRDEIEALHNRLGQSEKVRDKALAPILKSVNEMTKLQKRLETDIEALKKQDGPDKDRRMKDLKDILAMCEESGSKISTSLDKVIDQHRKIGGARTSVDKAKDIVEAMEKRIGNGLDNLEIVENGARALVGIGLGVVNGALGAAASTGDALSVIITASGGAADAIGGFKDSQATLAEK